MLAAGFSLASALAVAAQTPPADDDAEAEEPAAEAAAAPDVAVAPDVNDPDILKDIDVSKLDWSQLDLDASPLGEACAEGTGCAEKQRRARTPHGRRTKSRTAPPPCRSSNP